MDLVDHPGPVLLPSSPTSTEIHHDLHDASDDDLSDESPRSASARGSSGPDEPIFDAIDFGTRHSSPHTSDDDHHGDDEHGDDEHGADATTDESCDENAPALDDGISELPTEPSRLPSYALDVPGAVATGSAPFELSAAGRSPFRNPSSVRAMQLDTTPPHHRPGSGGAYRFAKSGEGLGSGSPSRNTTPRSHRSTLRPHSSANSRRSPTRRKASPPARPPRREHPLVLLHVTVLPVAVPRPGGAVARALPAGVRESWTLLAEKVTAEVRARGILVPHPREDYDLLAERLLESLELKAPRIRPCGHFHLSPEEAAEVEREWADEGERGEVDGGGEDVCEDCGQRIKDGRSGSVGSWGKRWDIRIYAANGLMRAGAWGAAWREMERVDVEIQPWIEDGLRRELELLRETDEALRRSTGAEPIQFDGVRTSAATEQRSSPRDAPAYYSSPLPSPVPHMDDQRRREIYGDLAQQFADDPFVDRRVDGQGQPTAVRKPPVDVPIAKLLANYVRLLMQDRRNVAVALLSLMVVFLALRPQAPVPLPAVSELANPVSPAIVPVPDVPQPKIDAPDAMPVMGIETAAQEPASAVKESTHEETAAQAASVNEVAIEE